MIYLLPYDILSNITYYLNLDDYLKLRELNSYFCDWFDNHYYMDTIHANRIDLPNIIFKRKDIKKLIIIDFYSSANDARYMEKIYSLCSLEYIKITSRYYNWIREFNDNESNITYNEKLKNLKKVRHFEVDDAFINNVGLHYILNGDENYPIEYLCIKGNVFDKRKNNPEYNITIDTRKCALKYIRFSYVNNINDFIKKLRNQPIEYFRSYSGTHIKNSSIGHLACAQKLKHLSLKDSPAITNKSLKFLSKCPLEYFSIQYNNIITSEGIKELSKCPLKCFKFINTTGLTDECLLMLSKCSTLRTLKINFAYNITDEGIKHLRYSSLTNVSMYGLENITNDSLLSLSKCPLKYLNIQYCENITDEGLAYLKNCPLEHIEINNKITDKGLAFLKNCPLKSFDSSENENITDKGLSYLKNNPLKYLDLNYNKNITDKGLSYLQNCLLEHLDLQNNENITDKGLSYLKNNPLNFICLGEFSKISDKMLKYLLERKDRKIQIGKFRF